MQKINPKELEILDILWNKDIPMTSKDILEAEPVLVMSTIQSTLKKLLKKELVVVDGITYSGTVLTRTYVPTISQEEFVLRQYKGLDATKLVSLVLENVSDRAAKTAEIKEIIS
ncbi:BlaI/MecI/CopY family transcriptional regulator [Streptococcaceae bacterium ESL0729]|nr:BlaI/MecI/CopY family transcriptional regulator [Streptococcaceae bacterium ESL0729]